MDADLDFARLCHRPSPQGLSLPIASLCQSASADQQQRKRQPEPEARAAAYLVGGLARAGPP